MVSVSVDVKSKDSFMIAIYFEGAGKLTDSNGSELDLKQGETVLLPASVESFALSPTTGVKLMTCYI